MADIASRPPHPAKTLRRAFYELTKPGIAGYVMVTAGVSAFVASHGRLGLATALHVMVATGLSTAGALALNQYVERDFDAAMVRTRHRPIPAGRVAPLTAFIFGSSLLMVGVVYMALALGALPALITVLSAAAYHGVYTPLKTRTSLATLAGGVPGALPTLIGWTAVTGRLDAGGLGLFAIAYAWQLPHVLGLAWMLRVDYERVGFRLIPPHDEAGRIIGRHMLAWLVVLLPLSGVPTWLGYTGWVYFAGSLLASLAFLSLGLGAARDLTDRAARKVFFGSLLYHPVLLGLMLFDTVRS
ncbi:MAG TPA: heme o synthase [Longimicrobiales bacterium]|nr:heme o synthase [Longimicrobiales bacterium]